MRTFLSCVLLAFLSPFVILSQTPQEIIKKSEEQIKGKTSYGVVEMTIITPDFKRTLKMEGWWVGNEKALIEIKYPKKEEGNKTLKRG